MERFPLAEVPKSAEAVAAKIFGDKFEVFSQGNPKAFRGRSIEIEESNSGRRIVFFTETEDALTAEHVLSSFEDERTRISGALKLMKDLSPARVWRPSDGDQNGSMLFAIGEIEGTKATPQQIGDFTPLREALERLDETG